MGLKREHIDTLPYAPSTFSTTTSLFQFTAAVSLTLIVLLLIPVSYKRFISRNKTEHMKEQIRAHLICSQFSPEYTLKTENKPLKTDFKKRAHHFENSFFL